MIDDQTPAFPGNDIAHASGQIEYGHMGMSLRDYFAAKAMVSTDLAMTQILCHDRGTVPKEEWSVYVAKKAYEMADAMMEARKL